MIPLLRFFRLSGQLQAASYLLLLGVALPLKHWAQDPRFLNWTGPLHLLFLFVFGLAVMMNARRQRWTPKTSLLAFASALVPLGPILFQRYVLPRAEPELSSAEAPPG